MLIVVGVIPYADASLVFAVNHTFTDQVTGIGSTVRRAVARGQFIPVFLTPNPHAHAPSARNPTFPTAPGCSRPGSSRFKSIRNQNTRCAPEREIALWCYRQGGAHVGLAEDSRYGPADCSPGPRLRGRFLSQSRLDEPRHRPAAARTPCARAAGRH